MTKRKCKIEHVLQTNNALIQGNNTKSCFHKESVRLKMAKYNYDIYSKFAFLEFEIDL